MCPLPPRTPPQSPRCPAGGWCWRGCCWLLLFFCGELLAQNSSPAPVDSNLPRWAQLADTVFQHLSLEQGLQQQVVTALLEDDDGYLWMGTQDGLARWDGYRFRVFRRHAPEVQDVLALPDNYISSLFKDDHGDVWVGTVNGGLARFQRDMDRFEVLQKTVRGSVNAMLGDGAGGVWVATQSGLDHIAHDGQNLERLRHDPARPDSLPDNRVLSLMRSNDGWLWVGTYQGVVRRPFAGTGQGGFQMLPLRRQADSLPPPVWKLYQDQHNRVWIGTSTAGAFWLDPGAAQPYPLTAGNMPDIGTQYVDSFVENGQGQLWIGTYGQGIFELNLDGFQAGSTPVVRRIMHEQAIAGSLAHNTVWSMLRDRSGLIWVGGDRGVSRHDPGQKAVLSLFSVPGRTDRISGTDIHSVACMPDGRIWLGFDDRGIDILAPDGVKVASLLSDPSQPLRALPRKQVIGISLGARGQVFIATTNGLYQSDLSGHAVMRVPVAGMRQDEHITGLLAEGERVWVGTADGLWLLEPGKGQMGRRMDWALSDNRVMAILHAEPDILWLGTQNGLNRVDVQTGRVEQFHAEPGQPNRLSAGFIPDVLEDASGRLWIATFSGGVNVLLPQGADGQRKVRHIGTSDGLPSANINKILQDRQGFVWVSTDDGLARIDPANYSVKALQRADGVAIRTFWAFSGTNTPHGELLFGGDSGLTVLRPEWLQPWQYRPPLVFSEVRVMGQRVALNRHYRDLKKNVDQDNMSAGTAAALAHANQDAAVLIGPDANSFSVEFAALDYSAPEFNRYAYKLEPWDEHWIETDATRRTASYTNLPPGFYHLRVRGSNRNGLFSEPDLVLPVHVLPTWYQTWWWHGLMWILGICGLVASVQLRTRVLRQRQHALETLVEQRTAQLEKQQEQVLATNVELHDANEALNHANAELAQSTLHLQRSNEQLESTLKTLRDTQVQLVQQAKIASLGTLTAGVAHEINNPANFAYVGAYNLGQQLQAFRHYLFLLAGQDAPPELVESLNQHFATLSESLASITEGTGRIRDLVKDLRTFSRLDEAEWKAVPIADSLQATVNLVRTQYASLVEIRCDLRANPELECFPAQLNQAFMHLIVNACQAIQSRPAEVRKQVPGRLLITSFIEENKLVFEFEDNGIGISNTSMEHIFDPFFTTRTVGQGMGMGLSISFGIVQKHGGSISVRSREGEGSCFRIHLPLDRGVSGD